MTEYLVTISETFSKNVVITAESQIDAEKKALKAYKDGRINVDKKDADVTVSSLSVPYAIISGELSKEEYERLERI